MFSYKANAICMAGMTMPAGAAVAASHCWNRVRKPGQLINYARFWPHRWTFAKNRTAHAQTHYRKSTQWQWASFVSAGWPQTFSNKLYWLSIDYPFLVPVFAPLLSHSASERDYQLIRSNAYIEHENKYTMKMPTFKDNLWQKNIKRSWLKMMSWKAVS